MAFNRRGGFTPRNIGTMQSHGRSFSLFSSIIGLGIFVVFTLVALGIIGSVYDGMLDRRTFAAQTECLSKRMTPRRQPFTTEVTCIPATYRNDTTTVRYEAP